MGEKVADLLDNTPDWDDPTRIAIVELVRIVEQEWENDMLVGEAGDALTTIQSRVEALRRWRINTH